MQRLRQVKSQRSPSHSMKHKVAVIGSGNWYVACLRVLIGTQGIGRGENHSRELEGAHQFVPSDPESVGA
jgi:hypothetical protein